MRRAMTTTAAAGLLLALVAGADAQAPEPRNTYEVRALLGPRTAGTPSRPVRVRMSLEAAVAEAADQRPAVVERVSLRVRGLRVDDRRRARCAAGRINAAGDDRACPRGSRVATGTFRSALGRTGEPADQAITCSLRTRVYNAGRGRAAVFLFGGPTASPTCPDETAVAVPARWVRRSAGLAFELTLPQALRHPRPDLDQALVELRTSFGRSGYLRSAGGCRAGRRRVEGVFTPEGGRGGGPGVARAAARCRA